MAKHSEAEKSEVKRHLIELGFPKPGETVYTILRHVSQSGMSRRITPLVLVNDPRYGPAPRYLGHAASVLLDLKQGDNQDVTIGGAGMDMGFHLVYELSEALYGQGYDCLGDECPSNWHQGENYGKTASEPHKDGYALRHRWL